MKIKKYIFFCLLFFRITKKNCERWDFLFNFFRFFVCSFALTPQRKKFTIFATLSTNRNVINRERCKERAFDIQSWDIVWSWSWRVLYFATSRAIETERFALSTVEMVNNVRKRQNILNNDLVVFPFELKYQMKFFPFFVFLLIPIIIIIIIRLWRIMMIMIIIKRSRQTPAI